MDSQERQAPCARCGTICILGPPCPRIDYPLWTLEPAQKPGGLCVTCAAHWWIFSIDGFRWSFRDGPGVLEYPTVQAAIARLLGQMHPELATVDWGRLLAQWELPWPKDWALTTEDDVEARL